MADTVGGLFLCRTPKDIRKYWDPEKLIARSITGELSWDAQQGVVHIDTLRSQAVIGFLSDEPHKLGAVRLTSPNRFGAVYVTAMSGNAPIQSARRLLVTAVGPARSPGMEYEKPSRASRLGPSWHLKTPGEGPALLEAIVGELHIGNSRARELKVWTLDVTGKRREQVPVVAASGELVLKLLPEYKTVYYELAVE